MSEVPLREYIEQIIDLRFKALERQLHTATVELERRLEGMNEVREQLAAQRGQFVSRELYEAEHRKVREQVAAIESFQSRIVGYGLGIVGAATALVILVELVFRAWMIPR